MLQRPPVRSRVRVRSDLGVELTGSILSWTDPQRVYFHFAPDDPYEKPSYVKWSFVKEVLWSAPEPDTFYKGQEIPLCSGDVNHEPAIGWKHILDKTVFK